MEPGVEHDRPADDESTEDSTGLNTTPESEEDRDPLDISLDIDGVLSEQSPAPQLTGTKADALDPSPAMNMIHQHLDPDEVDPLEAQVRDEPNPELAHQHDEEQDPLDLAIIAEHQQLNQDEVSPVQEGHLYPPPVDEYD